MKSLYYKQYVWELPMRTTHWVNVLCIVTLSATGLFIGSPLTVARTAQAFDMGWVRFIHFTAGYLFAVSVFSRIGWALVTRNRYNSWREFFQFMTPEGRKTMLAYFRFYTFTGRRAPSVTGHNPLAATAYLGVYLLFLVMIGTGLALFGQYAPHGVLHKLTGWMFWLLPAQGVRLIHHCVMWLLLGFVIQHVYSAWLMDVKERSGDMSSIFTGYKILRKKIQ